MEAEEFNKLVDDTLQNCEKLLRVKADEYATEDKLFNFKQPTSMLGCNQAEVCLAYQMKHYASLVKIAKELNEGEYPSEEFLNEKISDMINYCLLFKANVIEFTREHKDIANVHFTTTKYKMPIYDELLEDDSYASEGYPEVNSV